MNTFAQVFTLIDLNLENKVSAYHVWHNKGLCRWRWSTQSLIYIRGTAVHTPCYLIYASISFAVCNPIFHFLDNSYDPIFKCLPLLIMLCTLRSSAPPSTSSWKVVAILTAPINRLYNVISLKTDAILVRSFSTCPNQTYLELLWSLSIALMARLLMIDVNEKIVRIYASYRLCLPALI